MDKTTFASYKFKPIDVIEGLNRYFAETKANRYRRVPLEIHNGEVKPGNCYVIRNIVFDVGVPKIKECGYGYVVCDPEEVVGVAINWLREEHDIFYTPGMEVPVEDFDVDEPAKEYEKETRTSDIFCEENLDMVPVAKVRDALGIAEDSDIFEVIASMKKSEERAHSEMYKARGEKYELLKQVREILGLNPEVNVFDALRRARGDMDAVTRLRLESSELSHRNHELVRRLADIRQAAGMADGDPTDLVKYVEALREKAEENSTLRGNLDYFADLAQKRQMELSNLRYEILKVYREIFDCSNGDPEGTDEETLQDILTEYKRCLELKNVAEEKTIKYKELARENEEQANKYNPNNSIRVELNLTPTADYKGTFDLEDLKKYIQKYGREKKLGVIESVDYQNAKDARAELAYLYKQVLGKEKLDRDLSPHEVMKAILDEYDKREDFIRELSCSLGFGHPVVKPDNIDQKEKDILERIESLKSGVWPCENSSTFAEHLKKEFPKFCKKYNVVPLTNASIHDWIQYIFDVLSDYRGMHDKEWARAEKLIKDKLVVEDSLSELRAKIREIYRSVVDDEWDGHLSYTSAMNDINEEYKSFTRNFEERTADWRKAQQELDRYRLAVGSLLGIPKEARDDFNAIERAFTFSKKAYESLQEFRNDVCEIFDIPRATAHKQILKEIHDVVGRYDELEDFRADICGALDIDGMLGTPKQNDKYILEQVEKLKSNPCDYDNCALKKFRDDITKAIGMDYPTTNQFILNNVTELKKAKDDLQQKFQFQSGLRQQWHDRYESEHERANDEHKRAEKLKNDVKCWTKRCDSLQTALNNSQNDGVALQAFRNECKKLREEKAKVITALGQDIWDDCLK